MSVEQTGRTDGFTSHGHGRAEVTVADELISVEAHLEHILSSVQPVEPIDLRPAEALGLVLAEEIQSDEPVPAFANSAMDGYAVVAEDVAAARQEEPVRLDVTGEVAAGAGELPRVEPGTAVVIMTGAPLPPGATAVVPVEQTTSDDAGTVAVHVAPDKGANIRAVGEDVQPGQVLLPAGHRLRPGDVGLLAAVGVVSVSCIPSPRVAILATGDELVAADQPLQRGNIRDANGPMLSAMVREVGGIPHRTEIVGDDRRALHGELDASLAHADLVIVSGGASVGVYDLVGEVLADLGSARAVKVAMKPGKPQVFGQVDGVPVFGLPGNPVSSFVSFEVFVRPALRALQGRTGEDRAIVYARVAEPIPGAGIRRHFARVKVGREEGRWVARPTGSQGSHLLTSVVQADGLAEIPPGTDELAAGEDVRVRLLVSPG